MDGKYIKAQFKPFLVSVVIALVALALIFGFYRYSISNYKERDHIKNEIERCERVINREEGDLTDYSYCQRFLDWIKYNVDQE